MNASGSAATTQYLWGNTPAIDILRLSDNEGESYGKKLRICYAASGDIRNALRTIVDIPKSFTAGVDVVINDRDKYVAMRNVLILLFLTLDDKNLAIDSMIHFWFSATLTASHMEAFQSVIVPFFKDVCSKISGKSAGSIQSKKVPIGQGSIRVLLTRQQWQWMSDFLTRSIDKNKALQFRRDICLARVDHLDRHLLCYTLRPHCRIAKMRFRKEGVLLPFGQTSGDFTEPNPTLFDPESRWILNDSSDPLDGFSSDDITDHFDKAGAGAMPKNDLYGRLHGYLGSQLSILYDRIRGGINFEVLAQDASDLGTICKDWPPFDRIDTSNIVDLPYLGVAKTLFVLRPLLNTANRHSAILSLFMNAVKEEDHRTGQSKTQAALSDAVGFMASRASPPPMDRSMGNPFVIRVTMATDLFLDRGSLWKSYMATWKISESAAFSDMKARQNHQIVKAWPYGLTKRREEPGAQLQLEELITSGVCGVERYVEWVAS